MRALEVGAASTWKVRDDEELYAKVRDHVDRDHPEMELGNEQAHAIVAEGAYDK